MEFPWQQIFNHALSNHVTLAIRPGRAKYDLVLDFDHDPTDLSINVK